MDENPTSPGEDWDRLAGQWERNATEDPFWVILSDPRRGDHGWSIEDFFKTGEVEWTRVREMLAEVGALPDPRGRFVDFGCGVGRITRQLAAVFSSGVGIDVSETMVATARRLNPELEFTLNARPDLGWIPDKSAGFVYSHIVLQHIVPDLQRSFVTEFVRILAPGGVAAFQVVNDVRTRPMPIGRRIIRNVPQPAKVALKRLIGRPVVSTHVAMEMHPLSDADVRAIIDAGGGRVVASPYTNSGDSDHNGALRFLDQDAALRRLDEPSTSPILSRFYVVRKG